MLCCNTSLPATPYTSLLNERNSCNPFTRHCQQAFPTVINHHSTLPAVSCTSTYPPHLTCPPPTRPSSPLRHPPQLLLSSHPPPHDGAFILFGERTTTFQFTNSQRLLTCCVDRVSKGSTWIHSNIRKEEITSVDQVSKNVFRLNREPNERSAKGASWVWSFTVLLNEV
jgi:hypothetical protein